MSSSICSITNGTSTAICSDSDGSSSCLASNECFPPLPVTTTPYRKRRPTYSFGTCASTRNGLTNPLSSATSTCTGTGTDTGTSNGISIGTDMNLKRRRISIGSSSSSSSSSLCFCPNVTSTNNVCSSQQIQVPVIDSSMPTRGPMDYTSTCCIGKKTALHQQQQPKTVRFDVTQNVSYSNDTKSVQEIEASWLSTDEYNAILSSIHDSVVRIRNQQQQRQQQLYQQHQGEFAACTPDSCYEDAATQDTLCIEGIEHYIDPDVTEEKYRSRTVRRRMILLKYRLDLYRHHVEERQEHQQHRIVRNTLYHSCAPLSCDDVDTTIQTFPAITRSNTSTTTATITTSTPTNSLTAFASLIHKVFGTTKNAESVLERYFSSNQ